MPGDLMVKLEGQSRAEINRLIYKQLRKWFGQNQEGLAVAARRALQQSRQGEDLADEIRATVKRPVAYGSGFFPSAEAEVSRVRRGASRPLDMSLIGDLSASYEMVLSGPTLSPRRLDSVMERRRDSAAVLFELWVSHLLPVYAYDVYLKRYRRSDRSWYFEPMKTRGFQGHQFVQRVEQVLTEHGFTRLSRLFCAKPVASPHVRSYTGRPRVFDCLFTTTGGSMRLEFDARGFRTARLRVGTNWPPSARGPIKGLTDEALPALRVSWQDRYKRPGRLEHRRLAFGFPGGDTLTIGLEAGARVTSLRVRAKLVWTLTPGLKTSRG